MASFTGHSKTNVHHLDIPHYRLDKTDQALSKESVGSSTSTKNHIKALNIVLAYLDVGYYLCFVPFRFTWSPTDGRYKIQESKIRKVLAIAFHLLRLTLLVYFYNQQLTEIHISSSYLKSFRNAQVFSDFAHSCAFIQATFFQTDDFRLFFELVPRPGGDDQENKDNDNNSKIKVWLLNFIFIPVYKSLLKLRWHLGLVSIFLVVESYVVWTFTQKDVAPTNNDGNSPSAHNIHIQPVMSVILPMSFCYVRAVGESTNLLLLGFGLYLKGISQKLVQTIMEGKINYSGIMEQYLQLRRINDCTNSISNKLMFLFVIGSVPYISEIITSADAGIENLFVFGAFGSNYLICMLGSAEAGKKASELKPAFLQYSHRRRIKADPRESKDDDDVTALMILSELTTPDIGLKGAHFFTVTYSFVGVMLSQCIIYALIIVQLEQGRQL